MRFASGFAKAAVLKGSAADLRTVQHAVGAGEQPASGCSIGGRQAREVALARSWRCIHAGGMEAPEHVIDAETRAQILDAVLRRVIERYVDPDVAAKMEAAVRARIDAGEYDGIASGT